MRSSLSVLACAALAAAAPTNDAAAPLHIPIASRSMSHADGTINTEAFLSMLQRTLGKYHQTSAAAEVGSLLGGLLKKRANNLPLTDQVSGGEDELYYGPATVGSSAPQTFTIDFDTGSADFFVPGPKCGSSQGCVGTTKYNQMGTDEKNTTSVTYGSGSISGENYFDTVSVAGLTASHTNVISLTTAAGFSSSASEGLMGMGFSTIANSKQPTFFENLISQGKVALHEFSFYLGRKASNTQGNSEMTLGGVDSSKYTGSFTKVPVTQKGYWQVAVDAVKVSGASAGATTKGQAAIDTGTTIILAPTAAAAAIFAAIPGSIPVPLVSGSPTITLFAYPCNTAKRVSFVFAGKSFVINPLDFNFGSLTGLFAETIGSTELLSLLSNPASDASGGYCIAAIGGDDISPTENLYVVGDSFLKNWYATFSYVTPSVNFAKAV